MRKAFKLLFLFCAGLLSLSISFVFVLALVIGFQTSKGPLDLTFLKPHLQKVLKHTPYDLAYDTLDIVWPTLDDPIVLRAHNMNAKEKGKKGNLIWSFHVKNTELIYPLSSLWVTKGMPSHVTIQGAKAQINVKNFESNLLEGRNKTESVDIDFKAINQTLRSIVHLKKMDLVDCKVSLMHQNKETLFDISGKISQDAKQLFGDINIENTKDSGLISLKISYPFEKKVLTLKVMTQGFDSRSIKSFLPPKALEQVSFQDSKISFTYDYFLKTKKHKGDLSCFLSGLIVRDERFWKEPLSFPDITFKAHLKDHHFALKTFKTDVHGVPLYIGMKGVIDSKADTIASTLSVFVKDLTFQDVPKLWPQGAAPGAREWITENIQIGEVPKATFDLKSILNFSGHGPLFKLVKLGGYVNIAKTVLTYQKTMPAITDIKAKAFYDHEHFDIKVQSAKHHGLDIKGGHVFIGKFSDPVPHIDIKAKTAGDLGRALSIIDHPPLNYGRDIGLNPEKARGRLSGDFKMTFPLSSPFDPGSIQTYFKGKVDEAFLGNLVNLGLDFTRGDVVVDLRPENIHVLADGLVNQQVSKISVRQNFKEELLKISAKTFISDAFLEGYKKGIGVLFKGNAQTTIAFERHKKEPASLSIISDLKDVDLNTLLMKKPRNVPGSLRFEGIVNDGKLVSFSPISYQDENGWRLLISGSKNKDNYHKTLADRFDIHAKQYEKDILKLRFWLNKNGFQVLDIQGNDVDLKTYFKTDLSDSGLVSEEVKSMPLHLMFKAKRVSVGLPKGILNPDLDVRFEKDAIKLLQFKGKTEEGIGKNRDVFAEVHDQIAGPNKGMRKLRLQTEQGGAFLRAFDIFRNIQGGQLKVVAFNDPRFQAKSWIGKVRMRSFALLDTPFITKLLALSPSIGASAGSGKGIQMSTLKMRFGISKEYFEIHGLRAHGNGLGVNLSGLIEKARAKSINLKGSLVPLRGLNTAISNIPLLGPLITGGRNESLFSVAFGVGGTSKNPKVSSNPLSVLTPGVFKHFFGGKENYFTISDEWLNAADTQKSDIFDQEFDGF